MKRFRLIWLLISLAFVMPTIPIQYLYPVISYNDHVYCVYQSSPEIIRMMIWDSGTKELMPGLLPHYMPAGLGMLPNNAGYSFIDEGILRVQKFIKRTPKSLEFYAPIYDINVPEWIDEEIGYFAAKVREHYGIFQFNIEANLASILLDPKKDYLYPQKVGSSLFYIERVKRGLWFQFRVMEVGYPSTVPMVDDEMVAFKAVTSDAQAAEVFDFHNEPIAFLHMETEISGFLISYPVHIDEAAKIIPCSYYQLAKTKKGIWQEFKLFDFIIPSEMLISDSENKLYESMLPLLPRHIGTDIYFVDCSASPEHLNLNLYQYSCLDHSVNQLTFAELPGQHYFAPILIHFSLYCGGSGYGDRLNFIKLVK